MVCLFICLFVLVVVVVVELMNSGGMMEGMGKILLGKFPTHS